MAHIRETVNERLMRMKKLSNISEANYSLIGGMDEDDEMPDLTEPQADDPATQEDPALGGGEAPAEPPVEEPEDTMNNVADDGQMGVDVPEEPEGGEMSPEMGMEEPMPEEPSVEEKQNEIIQLNIFINIKNTFKKLFRNQLQDNIILHTHTYC